ASGRRPRNGAPWSPTELRSSSTSGGSPPARGWRSSSRVLPSTCSRTVSATFSTHAMAEQVLDVSDLAVTFPTEAGSFDAVKEISFAVGAERVALVGESGSGKTMTARAIMGLVPSPGRVRASRMSLLGTDLLALDAAGWNDLRGARIGLVLQDPRFALNPVQR